MLLPLPLPHNIHQFMHAIYVWMYVWCVVCVWHMISTNMCIYFEYILNNGLNSWGVFFPSVVIRMHDSFTPRLFRMTKENVWLRNTCNLSIVDVQFLRAKKEKNEMKRNEMAHTEFQTKYIVIDRDRKWRAGENRRSKNVLSICMYAFMCQQVNRKILHIFKMCKFQYNIYAILTWQIDESEKMKLITDLLNFKWNKTYITTIVTQSE